MGYSLKSERKLVGADEVELLEKSHHPALGMLGETELADLRLLVRNRRDRAQTLAHQQRREARGKAEPRGARAASDNSGTLRKVDVLAGAMRRINAEVVRRQQKSARAAQIESAHRALAMRRAAQAAKPRPAAGQTPGVGMAATASSKAKAVRNPAKAGAVSQHTKNMQAKRDGR
ncbi:MAG: hypothetical protein ACRCUI_14690 [Polymorphobacter sp.]